MLLRGAGDLEGVEDLVFVVVNDDVLSVVVRGREEVVEPRWALKT